MKLFVKKNWDFIVQMEELIHMLKAVFTEGPLPNIILEWEQIYDGYCLLQAAIVA